MALKERDENIAETIANTLRHYANLIEERGIDIEGETAVCSVEPGVTDITDQVGDPPFVVFALSGQVDITVSFRFADWQERIDQQIKKQKEILEIHP